MEDLNHITEFLERNPQTVDRCGLGRINLTISLRGSHEGLIHHLQEERVEFIVLGEIFHHGMDFIDTL